MGINSVWPNYAPPASDMLGGGENPKIKELEQKLSQLEQDKAKAVQAKDDKKRDKIEKQILEIQKRIQQLKQQENKNQQAGETLKQAERYETVREPGLGEIIDEYA